MRMPWRIRTALMATAVLALGLAAPAARAADRDDQGQPWMGVFLQEYDRNLKDAMGEDQDGVLISRIVEGGPADKAGLRRGDLILRMDRHPVTSVQEVTDLVKDARVGEEIDVDYLRGSRRESAQVTLEARPGDDETPQARSNDEDDDDVPAPPTPRAPVAPRAPQAPMPPDRAWMDDLRTQLRTPGMTMLQNRPRLGVQVQDLEGDMADAMGVDHGVLVTEVMDDMPAKRAGIRAGDVITRVNGRGIDSSNELIQALRSAGTGRVTVELVRRGARRTVTTELERSRVRTRTFNYTAPKVERERDSRDSRDDENAELREEIRQLKEEIRQLKEDMRR